MIRRKIRNVENLNEYLSQCGNEYSILGFDINTVIGAVMLKTYRQKSPRNILSVISVRKELLCHVVYFNAVIVTTNWVGLLACNWQCHMALFLQLLWSSGTSKGA